MSKKLLFFILVITLILLFGGVSIWKFKLQKEEKILKEEKVSQEKEEITKWKTLKDGQFSIQYIGTWKEKEFEVPLEGEIIGNFWSEEPPQSCNETIFKQTGIKEGPGWEDFTKKDKEEFINSLGYSLIRNEIELTSDGEKYILVYEFADENNVKNKVWSADFNCGNYFYQIGISCRGEQYIEKYTPLIEEIIKSLFCERKTKEAEEKIKIALLKLEKAKNTDQLTKNPEIVSEIIQIAKEAIKLDYGNPEIWFQRGNIYFEIKDFVSNAREWAIYCYKKAIKLAPTNPTYQKKLKEAESL